MAPPPSPPGLGEAATAFVGRSVTGAPPATQGLRRDHAEGRLTETRLLELLAALYGTRLVDLSEDPPDPKLRFLLDPALCLRWQIVPWRRVGRGIVLACARPEDLARALPDLRAALPAEERLAERPVLAGCAAIQAVVADSFRPELTDRMAQRVADGESCRHWGRRGLRLGGVAGVVGLIALLLWHAPLTAFALLYGWATLTMIFSISLKSAAAAAHLLPGRRAPQPQSQPQSQPPPLPPEDLPPVSILVPMFREKDIADSLIRNLHRLRYPRDRLEVLLCLEEDDAVTHEAVAKDPLPPWMRVITVPRGAPQTKPRAMNYALDFCRGSIVGIFDAEDRPEPDQLLKMARHFHAAGPETVCLQGVLDYYNPRQSWIARCFTIEYNSWFRLVLPGLSRLRLPIPLGGTTLYIRRTVLEEIGAWDAHNVTEDADLGIRLARRGYRTEILDSTTWEEANCRPLPWIKQRSRWLKGYIVTYFVHMRRPGRLWADLGPWAFAGFQMHFTAAISQFVLAPVLWSSWMISLGLPHPLKAVAPPEQMLWLAMLFFLAEVLNITLGLLATRAAPRRYLWAWVPTLTFYYPLGCLASYKAVYELIRCPFYWDKTLHGLSLNRPRGRRRFPRDP